MSNKKKSKKSTTKYKKFKSSKIIPIIAIFEVIVLISVMTFAWFYLNANKSINSGIITVNADSGLDIDFKDADKTTFIDIFDYIDEDNFYFEPATSVDGRNIYFPTSGTFNKTDTESMVFRDGTINDINSKYINIDFELTNTTNSQMDVFLSHNSFFRISSDSNVVNGKALRLALYNNDGNTGNITSNIISNIKKTSSATEESTSSTEASDGEDVFTIYFENTSTTNWSNVKAYVWHNGEDSSYITAWPGDNMVNVAGNLYSYTFSNPYTTSESTKTYYYDSVVFNNGSGSQTVDITSLNNGYKYVPGNKTSGRYNCSSSLLTMSTVYFLKPNDWEEPRCVVSTATSSGYFAGDTGQVMEEVTTGIYSYTFPSTYTFIKMIDTASATHSSTAPSSSNLQDGKIYYFPSGGVVGELSTIDYKTSSIYFYNIPGWDQPYAYVNAMADAVGSYTYSIPLIALSGNLYYCTLPTVYLYDRVYSAGLTDLAGNCQVYFGDDGSNPAERTSLTYQDNTSVYCKSEYVYTPSSDKDSNGYYYMKSAVDYSDEVNIDENSYAVISPGVSAGFQRAANPVNRINYTTGSVDSVIPTFASSFDDFLMGSSNPVFTIDSQETVNMSMIIWLEGTDAHCTSENYAGKDINLYLEFATALTDSTVDTYTYQFIDSTEQVWTSDTITNAATGVTVSPVMQLYDDSMDRGYLMSAKTYTTYAGKKKVRVWQCTAPQSLVNTAGHEIQFRRVNPYDESEVWNRWEAGEAFQYKADSLNATTKTVTFTAFADGAPDYGLYKDTIANLPAYSCGGLWGSYETELLTVYDGRKDRDIGSLSFGYKYTYPGSNKTVTVECSSSGYRDLTQSSATYFNNFYSIVVPKTIYTHATDSYFIDYKGVNSAYAINSNLNTGITAGNKWSSGTVDGRFYEFNEEYNFSSNTNNSPSSNMHSYWGSDVLYIQGESTLSVSYSSSSNKCFMQVKFTGTGSTTLYSYLYEHNDYAGGKGYGYVAVVPSGSVYTNYYIQRTLKSSHSKITRELAKTSSLTSSTESDTDLTVNVVNQSSSSNDARIILMNYDYKIIYYQSSNWDSKWNHPVLRKTNNTDQIHSGDDTTKITDNDKKVIYAYHVPSNLNARFFWDDADDKYSVDIQPADGYAYYPKTYGNSIDVGGYNSGLSSKGLYGNGDGNGTSGTYNTAINSTVYNNASWPEYTASQVKS